VSRTENAMYRGIAAVKPGKYLYEVGKAIEKYIDKFGYSIVRDYGGHGIGKNFHEDPHVFLSFQPGRQNTSSGRDDLYSRTNDQYGKILCRGDIFNRWMDRYYC